jgi:hypothetical protein
MAMVTIACSVPAEDVDLSASGVVYVELSRNVGSNRVYTRAFIENNETSLFGSLPVRLADDQLFFINGVPLIQTPATILGLSTDMDAWMGAVDYPGSYEVSFSDIDPHTMMAQPPEDIELIMPASVEATSASELEVSWIPPTSSDTQMNIRLSGSPAITISEEGAVRRTVRGNTITVTIRNVDDGRGTHVIEKSTMEAFSTGGITLSLTRSRTVSQDLGFADGEITLSIIATRALIIEEAPIPHF